MSSTFFYEVNFYKETSKNKKLGNKRLTQDKKSTNNKTI